MFKKVLIAEDIDAVNTAVKELLLNLGAQEVIYAQYCDEAYLKLKKAAQDQVPFELIISDLSFKKDHRDEQISSGEELTYKIKQDLPDSRVIIHSVEDHPGRVKKILPNVNAYVCKGRHGLRYLKQAIDSVYEGKEYLSPDIRRSLEQQNIKELSEYEVTLLRYISEGYTQDDISEELKNQGISPYSKSSVEKKLKELREDFGAKTNPHLLSIVISLQLI